MDLDSDSNAAVLHHNSNTNGNESDSGLIGSMLSEALHRKERLRQIRLKIDKKKSVLDSVTLLENDDQLPKPVFRNYKPQSDELKEGELPTGDPMDLKNRISAQLEAADAPIILNEVNLINLAPRKPDWDLKRGVEKKIRKLERRTQRVIAELIRERLQNVQSTTNLQEAIS